MKLSREKENLEDYCGIIKGGGEKCWKGEVRRKPRRYWGKKKKKLKKGKDVKTKASIS